MIFAKDYKALLPFKNDLFYPVFVKIYTFRRSKALQGENGKLLTDKKKKSFRTLHPVVVDVLSLVEQIPQKVLC